MNIYEKVSEARMRFQSGLHKMSGENKFAGYKYYELSDILPQINKLALELNFFCQVTFNSEKAELIITDTEKPEDIIFFSSPMSEANLKGCHAVQNLGAVQTYIKRYLYQNAFEIVENDSLNAVQGKPDTTPERTGTTRQPAKQPEQVKTPEKQKGNFQALKTAIENSQNQAELDKVKLAIGNREWTSEEELEIGNLLTDKINIFLAGVM